MCERKLWKHPLREFSKLTRLFYKRVFSRSLLTTVITVFILSKKTWWLLSGPLLATGPYWKRTVISDMTTFSQIWDKKKSHTMPPHLPHIEKLGGWSDWSPLTSWECKLSVIPKSHPFSKLLIMEINPFFPKIIFF